MEIDIKKNSINFIIGSLNIEKLKWSLDKKDMGFISFKYNKNKTVKEVITEKLQKYNHKVDEKHIIDSLKMVELNNTFLNRKLEKLSSGEVKRVLVASTLAYNPKVIIAESDILNLDIKGKNNLIKIFRILKNRFSKTIILFSNDMDFTLKLADYIFVFHNDKKVKEGNKYEIFLDDKLTSKYHINIPNVIEFSKVVYNKKNVKLGFRDEINDLLKDIYRKVV